MELTEKSIAELAVFLKEEEKAEITIKKYVRDVEKFYEFAEGKELSNYCHVFQQAHAKAEEAIASLLDFTRKKDQTTDNQRTK